MILEKTSNDNSFHEILTEIQQVNTECLIYCVQFTY